jgi:hypothetical protein
VTYQTEKKHTSLHSSKSVFLYLSNIIICFFSIASIFSPIRTIPYFNIITAILVFTWFVLIILDDPKFLFLPTTYNFIVYVFIFYTILFPYLFDNNVISNRFWGLAQIPIFYIAYQNNKQKQKQRINNLIIFCSIPFIIITSLITINAYTFDPFISRKIKSTELGYRYMEIGIGGYEFVYFLVICVVILLYIVFNNRFKLKKSSRFLWFFLLILFSINIIMSNYSIALYLILISFTIRLFIKARNKKSTLYYALTSFLIIIILSQLFIIDLLNLLIYLSGNSLNASRFFELKQFISGIGISDSIEARFDRWLESLITFIHYPFLGIVQTKLKYSGGFLVGFGQHSQFLDVFALFGFVIGLLQIYIFAQPIFSRFKNFDNSYSGLSIQLFIVLFILFTINNATPSTGFAFFFIFPAVYDWEQTYILKKLRKNT